VIAKTFARIHHANLINWGLIPMTFRDPLDYEHVGQNDELEITDIRTVLARGDQTFPVRNNTKNRDIQVSVDLTTREREYLLAGGRLAYVGQHPLDLSTRPAAR